MRNRKIIDIDDFITKIAASQPHELSGSYVDDKEELKVITILSDDQFKLYMETFFYYYKMVVLDPEDPEDMEDKIIDQFNALWLSFQVEEPDNIDKLLASY